MCAQACPPEPGPLARDLPRLLALWPHEIEDPSPAAHVRLVTKLRAALRAERQRGLSGHWTYDLARHRQLLAAYRAEHALLTAERVAVRRAEGEARGPRAQLRSRCAGRTWPA